MSVFKVLFIWLASISFLTYLNLCFGSNIHMKSVQELNSIFKGVGEDTLILLDVDDTLITPKANMFRYKNNPHRFFIDELKKNKGRYPNFANILSQWRLQRQTQLVCDEWPELIERLKKSGATVFALTHMDTGKLGDIPSIEEWRYQELVHKNIHFSPDLIQEEIKILKQNEKGYAVFYKGILLTGPFNKVDVLAELLQLIKPKPSKIILIDDREEQVVSTHNFVSHILKIPFTGIVFKAAEELPGTPNSNIIQLQKKHMIEKMQWLEDEQALEILNQNN